MIHHGDLFDVLPTFGADSIDACVTDPPYELGFMGKAWDGSGVAFRPETWAEVYRVMKPGAYLVAFSGSRTYHRMACAIEDAGFTVRDSLCWLYGSGFPKSHNLGDGKGTALKPAHEPIALAWKPFKGTIAACHEQHGTAALNVDACRVQGVESTVRHNNGGTGDPEMWRTGNGGAFASGSDAGRWPANVVLDEDAAAMLDEQSGELQSGARSGPNPNATDALADAYAGGWKQTGGACLGSTGGASRFYYVAKPSRVEREYGLDRCEIVTIKWSSWGEEDQQVKLRVDTGQFPPKVTGESGTPHGSVSAWSTFLFGNGSTVPSLRDSKSIIVTKTSSITASKTLNWLARSLTSANIAVASGAAQNGGSPAESAARSTPSLSITSAQTGSPLGVGPVPSATLLQINGNAGSPASHPTVKPVELMRWLVKLVTPPGGIVLDPFTGSGTTGMACRYEHRQFIGIEREAEYVAIAEARIAAVAPLFGEQSA